MKGRLLAKVGNIEIFESDVNGVFDALAPEIKPNYEGAEGQRKLLDEVIFQELYYLDAVDKGYDKEPEFVARINEVKRGMLRDENIRRTVSAAVVTDDEIRKFYNEHGDMLAQPEVRASHILVETLEAAQGALKRIKDGEAFADVAKDVSLCPSRDVGGDLGFFRRGMMVPEFEEAVFAMNNGDVSEPVQTQFGYHIIFKSGEKGTKKPPFDEAKASIEQILQLQKQNELFIRKVEEFQKKYEVKRF